MISFRHLAALFAVLALTASSRAQVVYVGEIFINGHTPWLGGSPAPFDPSDPYYTALVVQPPWATSSRYYRIYPDRDTATNPADYPSVVTLTHDSYLAFAGRNTSKPIAFVLGFRKALHQLDFSGLTPVTLGPLGGFPVTVGQVYSLAAADRTHLTIMADSSLFSINVVPPRDAALYPNDAPLGEMIERVALTEGTGPREFSTVVTAGYETGARYHAYGPNGLLYILDYGNSRVQLLDPDHDYAYVSEFALESSVTTANMQFAIGITGNLYFGDNLGGGSVYSADGDFLGAFVLPVPAGDDGSGGMDYITTDAAGYLYVFDDAGIHRYQDLSVTAVPEPSTYAALFGFTALALAVRRRGRAER